MIDRFKLIKKKITAEKAAEFYGIHKNKKGLINCIFHDDKNPSMIIDDRFYCLGCGAKGDAVDFVAKLFNISLSDAADKIIKDFKLSKTDNSSKLVSNIYKSDYTYKAIESKCFIFLCEYLHLLDSWKKDHAPEKPGEEYDKWFIKAITEYDRIDYLIDIMLYGTSFEKLQAVLEALDLEEKLIRELNEGRDADERSDGDTKQICFNS